MRGRRKDIIERANDAVAALDLPPAVFKTCPWEPRTFVETGLRQWLRCCAAALRDGQVIGMPSHAVDEAWHGFILCTARYAAFCDRAYGTFLHHHPEGGAPPGSRAAADTMHDQLRRTVIAWNLVAEPGEHCVLWDLDAHVGVDDAWGVGAEWIAVIERDVVEQRGRQVVRGSRLRSARTDVGDGDADQQHGNADRNPGRVLVHERSGRDAEALQRPQRAEAREDDSDGDDDDPHE